MEQWSRSLRQWLLRLEKFREVSLVKREAQVDGKIRFTRYEQQMTIDL